MLLFYLFITLMTYGLGASALSINQRQPFPTIKKTMFLDSKELINKLSNDNQDQESPQFQNNNVESEFELFPYVDDNLTVSSSMLTRTTTNLIAPSTNEITASESHFSTKTDSDISLTFTTQIVRSTSEEKLPNTDSQTPKTITEFSSTSTFTQTTGSKETQNGETGKSSDKNNKATGGVTTTTQIPDGQTHHTMPAPEHLQRKNKTGTVALRGKCNTTDQCSGDYTECRINMCKCQLGYLPRVDNADLCGEARTQQVQPPSADPTMIGVVIGLVLMSFTLCVVMRLFAKARFQENRTIFNTPNPRLMNVSLLTKGPKNLLRGSSAGPGGAQRSRRGSQTSINSDGGGVDPGPVTARKEKPPRSRPHRQPSTETAVSSEAGSRPSSTIINKPTKSRVLESPVASNSHSNV